MTGTKANYISTQRSDKRPIIHWASEDNKADVTLIFPDDGKLNKIKGLIESHDYESGTIVQLERIGYGIVLDDTTILFTHE